MFIGLKVLTVRIQKYQKGTICRNTKFLSITYKYLIFIVLKVLIVREQEYQKGTICSNTKLLSIIYKYYSII